MGETPVSKQHCRQRGLGFASHILRFGPRIHTDRAIASSQCHAPRKQALLPTRTGGVSKRRPTLPRHPCLLSSCPSKYSYGAKFLRCSKITSQNTSDGFPHTAIYGRNAPKQSPPEYSQAIGVSSGLRQYLFSNDKFSFKVGPHTTLSADAFKIEGLST